MTDGGSRPRKILAIHRYFWPDTAPYGVILRSIVRRWSEDGHDVTVLSTQPSYRTALETQRREPLEDDGGVRVRRFRLAAEQNRGIFVRLMNVVSWTLVVFYYAVRHGRYDVIMVATTPPVLAAAAARYAARITGARLIYHCMDIHPEIGRVSGAFGNPVLFRMLRRIDAANCKSATCVVALSDDMRATLQSRQGAEDCAVVVINNFNTGETGTEASGAQHDGQPHTPLRIIFAGNLGRFQGLESVADALQRVDDSVDYEMCFVGGGLLRDSLMHRLGEDGRVRFVPQQTADEARRMIRDSDFCLVSLAPEISRYAFPSKTMAYLGEGKPLLACVEADSSLAALIDRENLGVAVPPSDPDALAQAIVSLATDTARATRYTEHAARVGPGLFDERRTLDRWSGLLASL